MLYQLSHFRSVTRHRNVGAESQNRTGDTAIFSRVLYLLSYLGPVDRRPIGSDGCPRIAHEARVSRSRLGS